MSFPENLKFPYHFDGETFSFLALSIYLFIISKAGNSGSTTGITGRMTFDSLNNSFVDWRMSSVIICPNRRTMI
jgi:hypothetical protein